MIACLAIYYIVSVFKQKNSETGPHENLKVPATSQDIYIYQADMATWEELEKIEACLLLRVWNWNP